MGVLIGMCADDSRAAEALAVPFLIRIATDPHHRHRGDALGGLAAPARARYFGVASRGELLLHRLGPQREDYDDYGVEVTGYPAGWSVAAARAAMTAGAPVLLPLLDSSDPAMRIDASCALATAADPGRTVRSAFATRFAKEQDPMAGPPWFSPQQRPHVPTRTSRPPHGSTSCGRTGRRPLKSALRLRSAGSAPPMNPPRQFARHRRSRLASVA